MFKFNPLLYLVSLLYAVNTETGGPRAESATFSEVTPSSSYAYAEAEFEHKNLTKKESHNTKAVLTTKECQNKTEEDKDRTCNGPNEEYKPDKKTCPLELCPSSLAVIRYACNPNEVGQPGCSCKPGYRRLNLNSTCIPLEQCPGQSNQPPICDQPNESAKCIKSCPPPKTCQNRNILFRCAVNTNETCKFQCICNNGFFRNLDGFCVTKDLCDKKCTGPNEEYKVDKKKCPPEICKSIVSRYACDPKEAGQPGCVCKSGFLRLKLNSTCMPTKDCPELANQPPECTLPNESLKCAKSCPPPRTCLTRNIRYKCPNYGNETCTPECVCDDGFYRNSDGFCVSYDLCDEKCGGPNEEYKPNKKTCPLELCPSSLAVIRYACNPNEVGQPGCSCKPGYRRLNMNSACILLEQCPGQENGICGEEEIFNKCPSNSCEYCPTNNEEARKCAASSSSAGCSPAKCTCRYNFKRLLNGTCVPTRDCPPFKCSHPKEMFDSCPLCPGDDCERATPNGGCPRIGRIGIPLLCRPSCRCVKNYWRNGGRCVPYEDCPNIKSKCN